MRISFDLDGVITNSEKWFYSTLDMLELLKAQRSSVTITELMYYSTRSVIHNPYMFLSDEDQGFIITARKPLAKLVTEQWLQSHGITLPVVFIDSYDSIDWGDYSRASVESGQRKASEIEKLGVSVHFDNNPIAVKVMRNSLPSVRIIQIGGEPCQSYM